VHTRINKIKTLLSSVNPRSPKVIVAAIVLILVTPLVFLAISLYVQSMNTADTSEGDAVKGMIYDGLGKRQNAGPCKGFFSMNFDNGETLCTHGPDPAPVDVDVRKRQKPGFTLYLRSHNNYNSNVAGVTCDADGQNGKRVQLIYARPSDKADLFSDFWPDFKRIAVFMNQSFIDSAAKTGGHRYIRFVHNEFCEPIVDNVVISANVDDSFDNMVNELRSKGYNRDDRKYLVWRDANKICGLANLSWHDDKPGPENESNAKTGFAIIDNGCWGIEGGKAEVHELGHVLGAVKISAPHSAGEGHCTDPYDNMCRGTETAKGKVPEICPKSQDGLFDCNNDDYFSTNPPEDSYLATHWNVANSQFLGRGSNQVPTPIPTRVPTLVPTRTLTVSPTISPNPTGPVPTWVCGGSPHSVCATATPSPKPTDRPGDPTPILSQGPVSPTGTPTAIPTNTPQPDDCLDPRSTPEKIQDWIRGFLKKITDFIFLRTNNPNDTSPPPQPCIRQ
jgi:hypothetical protein